MIAGPPHPQEKEVEQSHHLDVIEGLPFPSNLADRNLEIIKISTLITTTPAFEGICDVGVVLMREMSTSAKLYIMLVIFTGAVLLIWSLLS
jgi:hypothetical protein